MFARTCAIAVLVLAGHLKNAEAVPLTCALITAPVCGGNLPCAQKTGNVFFPQGFGGTVGAGNNAASGTYSVDNTAAVDTGSVCITFTNFDVANGGDLEFATQGAGDDYTFTGQNVPKQFTWSGRSALGAAAFQDTIVFTFPATATGTGYRFTCADGPCKCTSGAPTSTPFDQTGNVISANGESGTITATGETCVTFTNVDLESGSVTYGTVEYTGEAAIGPFNVADGDIGAIVYNAGPAGSEGSFTATCSDTTCAPTQLSPCTVTQDPANSLTVQDQAISSAGYPNVGYIAGANGVISVTGPACITFNGDEYGYNSNTATFTYQGTDLPTQTAPGPLSIGAGQTEFLQWDTTGAGTPGFQLLCNFGACDSPTTTTSAPTTTSTTTSASTTSTTSAPSTTSTTSTTQTTVVPFPVSSCTKKSCRQLVKAKKQRLFAAAGCGDSTSCKNAVKATMPYNGNKKKACKPKTRQDVCQNIYWYT